MNNNEKIYYVYTENGKAILTDEKPDFDKTKNYAMVKGNKLECIVGGKKSQDELSLPDEPVDVAAISNWSTWKNKFSIGVETIDSIISRGGEQEQIYDRSYEVKLSKYLSGGSVGQCDLYVIDHGYNDAGNNNGNDYSDLKSIPSDTLDRTYFIGAMNYIINKIKTDNFRASICIVSHYNDEGVFSNLVEAQRYVADYWNIPFIEIYDKIGFSTSSKITINGVTKTVKDWWLTDGIHPSSDTTGKALRHYAEVLYPLIRDVR